jgi:CubicO group peptidase (beta-lactamase class C family)
MKFKNILFLTILTLVPVLTGSYHLFKPVFHAVLNFKEVPPLSHEEVESTVYNTRYLENVEIIKGKIISVLDENEIPGLSVAVGLKGELLWRASYGYADIEEQLPLTTRHQFRIGSTSKALTSILLGKLLEQGKIDLDDKIMTYLPSLPPHMQDITVRQLASHQSGIRNYGTCLCFPIWEFHNTREFSSVTEALVTFIDDELLFLPNEGFSYSSYNYTLLSAVLEKAAGLPFVQMSNEWLFEPANMTSTSIESNSIQHSKKATFYVFSDGGYYEGFPVNNSNKWAGGGFVSTPTDLVSFANKLLNHDLISANTLNDLFTPQKLKSGELNPQNYALGWRSSWLEEGIGGAERIKYVHHAGTAEGSSSLFVLFPEHKLVVSVLINANMQNRKALWDMVFNIAEAFRPDSH